MHTCLYGEGEVRRIIGAVWSAASPSAKCQAVTQLTEVTEADEDGEQESVS